MNPQSTDFDKVITAIAEDLFGMSPRLSKCPSQVNYCVLLSFEGGIADRVIKIENRDPRGIEIERHLYPTMRACGLPVPEIEYTHEDYPTADKNFIIMPKFSDHSLREICRSTNEVAAIEAVRASGHFLRNLHGLFAKEFESFLTKKYIGTCLATNQERFDSHLDLSSIKKHAPQLSDLVEQYLSTHSKPTTKCLIHGQPHNKNILSDEKGRICVIDFGQTIGMSSPLQDLCILLISHDGWSNRNGNPIQRTAIIEGYGGIDNEDIQELCYWEFSFWVTALIDYLRFSEDPTKDVQFVKEQISSITGAIKEISNGGGLVNSL